MWITLKYINIVLFLVFNEIHFQSDNITTYCPFVLIFGKGQMSICKKEASLSFEKTCIVMHVLPFACAKNLNQTGN